MAIKKPVRSKSGITPLTVVLKPKKCNHGTCLYCPGGDYVPQSYTDKSPAIMRAMALKYDIREQVKVRLERLIAMGHPTEKIELILIGGTFLQYPIEYQYNVVKDCYDVLNGKKSETLNQAKKINEKAKHRIVAFCIENRPDNCSEEDIKRMREFGCTRVELGVQILCNQVYKKVNRGHTIQDVVQATKRLKDAGFKVGYHIMPGIPFSNPKKDLEKFKLVFKDKRFRPDQLKIYPCQIVETSKLAEIYKEINYKPYTDQELKSLIKKTFNFIPRYCRVMRIMREIPKEKMKLEAASTSMRGELDKELRKIGTKEIRLREVGFQDTKNLDLNVKLKITNYKASKGTEYFLEIVNKEDVLFGLLRLRINNNGKSKIAMVRELHVYGQSLNLGVKGEVSQHKGFGKWLMNESEKIAIDNGCKEIKVISGVGVREYYRRLGYELDEEDAGEYMVKKLK
jgi:elongator complex protein 3